MMYDLSRTERHHRAINAEPAAELIAKRCNCGKAVSAKQLAQHEKCVACLLAARVATLKDGDLDLLHWMLGATAHHPRSHWGFRNHYLVNVQDLAALQRLELAGFVRAGDPLLQLRYFHATAAGCKVAGLSAKRTAVALGLRP